MNGDTRRRLELARGEIRHHLTAELIPFWHARCRDLDHGGYLTNFDENGHDIETPEKYLNTQARFVWAFSRFSRLLPELNCLAELASDGVDFLLQHFWDREHEGWFWKVNRDGSRLDDGKVVYGQSFAIYALSEHHLATGAPRALEYASRTFELLQKYCADTLRGGYFENLEPDWSVSAGGAHGGDRKGLDTHMHLMEAFTGLFAASGLEAHRRKLLEIVDLIVRRMIDPESGCGGNQFDLEFHPIPAIAIRRTWNAEREGEAPPVPTDTTSYGHNVELAWLLRWALQTAGQDPAPCLPVIRRLLDHAIENGLDREYGGIYRDGTKAGGAVILEKEFWQHAEVLVGFLDGYELFEDPRYLDAFETVWKFVNERMVNHDVGEWRTLLDRGGSPLDARIGNPWKVCYHSGRAMVECLERLERSLRK